MIKDFKRRWQMGKVRPGDGSRLKPFRWWQLLSRCLFHIRLIDQTGTPHLYAVDVHHMTDAKSKSDHDAGKGTAPAALYRDGVQIARSNVPTILTVPGGTIQVATSGFGVKRMHYIPDDTGAERMLHPDPRSQEGRRAKFADRHPALSRGVGLVSLVVLLIALSLSILQGVESITAIPPVAEHIGTFNSPVSLPAGANIAMILAAFLAGYERATRLRHHWLIDSAAT
ncbi:MAG TPA: hypothetical protein IAA98_16320 [Candidatus Avipropionibacterium avicola]|uniref:Uncharacterized protein n=1 Tax=Candidatus Avipropionibacterium avicola TaxID=2840701 RepID=A0A9D1H106_9ACTN|nr:hypothetical protein [Candidatus Avipropionibacterium avicola]